LYDKEIVTQLFLYQPCVKPLVANCPLLHLMQLSTLGLDIWADMKTAL